MTEMNEIEKDLELLQEVRMELFRLGELYGISCARQNHDAADHYYNEAYRLYQKLDVLVEKTAQAAIASHRERVQKKASTLSDPFRPAHQRANVNGCCVDIFRHQDGAYTFNVSKSRSIGGWEHVTQGAADSEESCKMLAIRAANEVR